MQTSELFNSMNVISIIVNKFGVNLYFSQVINFRVVVGYIPCH
jgi:hypothetical protein